MGLWSDAPTRMKAFTPAKTLDEANEQIKDLQNTLAIMAKNVANIINGRIDSRNTREIGGWLVDLTELQSKDKDVGMSTLDTGADDVRFWAGGTDMNTAPWRVYESGKGVATGWTVQSTDGTYPYVVIDPVGDLIGAYMSANQYIRILPFWGGTSSPMIEIKDGLVGGTTEVFTNPISGKLQINNSIGVVFGVGAGEISLNAFTTRVPDWDTFYSTADGENLQQALDAKQNAISGFTGPIVVGTDTLNFVDGVLTSVT